jgi:hypothetical protein
MIESVSDRVASDADFVDGEVDHMNVDFATNFESGNDAYKATIAACENVSVEKMKELEREREREKKMGNGKMLGNRLSNTYLVKFNW